MSFVYVCMLSHVWLFATPWTVVCQVPLSWNFPGKNNGLGCHFLLQGIFPTQGSNLCPLSLLHCRCTLYHWATREAWVLYISKVNDLRSHRASCSLLFFSHSVMFGSLPPHGLQHARLPCPSLSPWLCSLMSIELTMPSNHLILCHPLLLLPSIFPSIRVFSNESARHIRWPNYWEFQLQHQSVQWRPRTDLL